MPVQELYNDFGFTAYCQTLDFKVFNEFFILCQFSGDIPQMLNCEFFIGTDDDGVCFQAKKHRS